MLHSHATPLFLDANVTSFLQQVHYVDNGGWLCAILERIYGRLEPVKSALGLKNAQIGFELK